MTDDSLSIPDTAAGRFLLRLIRERDQLGEAVSHDEALPPDVPTEGGLVLSAVDRVKAEFRPSQGIGEAERLFHAAIAEARQRGELNATSPVLTAAWEAHGRLLEGGWTGDILLQHGKAIQSLLAFAATGGSGACGLVFSAELPKTDSHGGVIGDMGGVPKFPRPVTLVKLAAKADSAPEPDGPVSPNTFRCGGKAFGPIPKSPFLALEAAWQNKGRCLDAAGLAAALGDSEDLLADSARASIRGELNEFFRRNKLPYHATVKGWFLAIQDGPPRGVVARSKASKKAVKRRQSR